MKFKYLGETPFEARPYESYVDLKLNGQAVELEILYEEVNLDAAKAQKMQHALDQLETIEANNRSQLQKIYKEQAESEVQFYLDELVKGILSKLKIELTQTPMELLQKAVLSRVTLYPNPSDYLLMFEYIVLPKYNHYILTMTYDTSCRLIDVIIES
jgi:hypothetical protein